MARIWIGSRKYFFVVWNYISISNRKSTTGKFYFLIKVAFLCSNFFWKINWICTKFITKAEKFPGGGGGGGGKKKKQKKKKKIYYICTTYEYPGGRGGSPAPSCWRPWKAIWRYCVVAKVVKLQTFIILAVLFRRV